MSAILVCVAAVTVTHFTAKLAHCYVLKRAPNHTPDQLSAQTAQPLHCAIVVSLASLISYQCGTWLDAQTQQ